MLQKICVLIIGCFLSGDSSFSQTLLQDLKKSWTSYSLSDYGSIRLPSYIKPINSIQDKIASGIAKEFQLPKNENNFSIFPDSNFNEKYTNSFFYFTAGGVDMDILKQSSYLNFYDSSFLRDLEYVQLKNLRDKLGKIGGKIIKSYFPEPDIIFDFSKNFKDRYYSINTKYIVEFPSFYKEPLTLYVVVIPNGKKSLVFEINFSTYDSEFWHSEMESILKEIKLKDIVK